MPEPHFEPDVQIRETGYRIGCIGAGMIMAECHLAAYQKAGFDVCAIASRTRSHAETVARRWSIDTVHDTPKDLIADSRIEIVDIAFPPDQQPALIRHALATPHVRAILAQKPLALTLDEARQLRDEARAAGKVLSVNQNMRYDQSMRVLRQILDQGLLGIPVFAQIDMHAIPHWQAFLRDYDRLTLANMSVHHLDILRYLFGDPQSVTCVTRQDPRTTFDHTDGLVATTLQYENGLLALSLEDVWSGPTGDDYEDDQHIRWRVEGTDGTARGTIGWPTGEPSTLSFASRHGTDGKWVTPTWETMWFPDAFTGVMEQLQYALRTQSPPSLSVADNVRTMALVEAAYRSADARRTVDLKEILIDGD
ncbi:MAG: Gfo/Idh/MocA family protein [Castellaniella sp.]|uniref:Gfo/Idh/MocA family protein n=1 Tax=Castellaniella sp. TaxID=1955812 RepID=UPI003A8AF903